MKFPRAVTDNINELLSSQGRAGRITTAESPKQFFELLKAKILEDIDRLTSESDVQKKILALADIKSALDEYSTELSNAVGKDEFVKQMMKRATTMGGYLKRLILHDVRRDDTKDAEEVMAYGKEHGYPKMVLARNGDGKPYKMNLEGEGHWDGVVRRRTLGGVANTIFEELLAAVRKNDIAR